MYSIRQEYEPGARSSQGAGSAAGVRQLSRDRGLLPIEYVATTALLIAFFAFAGIRIACDDVTWHLATARIAASTGAWPTANTFSHTFPDYPLYQQYPVFQKALHAVWQSLGWEGLTGLLVLTWAVVFAVFIAWGGGPRRAAALSLLWMLGLWAAQRRMILRPDMFSVLFLGVELLVVEAYLRGRARWLVVLPLVHLAWANSHQLYPLSLAIQLLLVAHVVILRAAPRLNRIRLGRYISVERGERPVPWWPAIVCLIASILLTLATPMGHHALTAMMQTGGSLAHHRGYVRELAPIWDHPLECLIAALCGTAALVAFWRDRRRLRPFDVGLWLVSLALAAAALRGIVFFGLISIGLATRTFAARDGVALIPPRYRNMFRRAAAALTILIAGTVVFHRWIRPPLILGGSQPGLGRSLGDWPDSAIDFLRRHPPPGEMLNLPWSTADALIWSLPERPVFVDPRFEAYPRPFLVDCMHAAHDDATLAKLVGEFSPMWIFADHRQKGVADRVSKLISESRWQVIYVDSQVFILIRRGEQTSAYLASLEDAGIQDVPPADPLDLLPGPPQLRARQRVNYALALSVLGDADAAHHQLALAAREADAAYDLRQLTAIIDAARAQVQRRCSGDTPFPAAL